MNFSAYPPTIFNKFLKVYSLTHTFEEACSLKLAILNDTFRQLLKTKYLGQPFLG